MDAELLNRVGAAPGTQALTVEQITMALPVTPISRNGYFKWPVGLAAQVLLGALRGTLAENANRTYEVTDLVLTPSHRGCERVGKHSELMFGLTLILGMCSERSDRIEPGVGNPRVGCEG